MDHSITPAALRFGEGSHGSVLSGNYAPTRVSSGWKSTYRTQKDVDQKNALRLERRRLYQQFLLSIFDATQGNGEAHLKARLEAGVIGSDAVLRALGPYNDYCASTNAGTGIVRDPKKYRLLLTDVLVAMREDVFDETKISRDEYGNLLPIS